MRVVKQVFPERLGLKKRIVRPLQIHWCDRHFGVGKQNFWVGSAAMAFHLADLSPILDIHWWKYLQKAYGERLPLIDEGLPKVKAEWLVHGHYHPQKQVLKQDKAVMQFNGQRKELAIFGERIWQELAGGKQNILEVGPLSKTLLSRENAFGGKDYAFNTEGKGYKDGMLPLIEYPDQLVYSDDDAPLPGFFTAASEFCAPRKDWFGNIHTDNYLAHFPNYPEDINNAYFNMAPQDQWLENYIQGGESYSLVNMLPEQPYYQGCLPKYRVRCFIECHDIRKGPWRTGAANDLIFKEVELHIDTCWLFPDAGIGLLVWRGIESIPMDEANHISHALIAYEHQDQPRSFDYYDAALEKRRNSEDKLLFFLDTNDLIPSDHKSAIELLFEEVDIDMDEEEIAQFQQPFITAKKKLDSEMDKLQNYMRNSGFDVDGFQREKKNFEANDPVLQRAKKFSEKYDKLMNELNPLFHLESGDQQDIPKIRAKDDTERKMNIRRLMRLNKDTFAELDEDIAWFEKSTHEKTLNQLVEAKGGLMRFEKENLDVLKPKTIDHIQSKYQEFDTYIDELNKKVKGELVKKPLPRFDAAESRQRMQSIFDESSQSGFLELMQQKYDHVDADQLQANIHNMDKANDGFKSGYKLSAHALPEGLSPHKKPLDEVRQDFLEALRTGQTAQGDFACIDMSDLDLSGVDLSGAYLEQVNLSNTNLTDANLTDAILVRADLTGATLVNTNISGANLGHAVCRNTTFQNIVFNRHVIIEHVCFHHVTMRNCVFDHLFFLDNQFSHVDFTGSTLEQCTFNKQKLDYCNFTDTKSKYLVFMKVALDHCDFTGMQAERLSMIDAGLEHCVFDRAILTKPLIHSENPSRLLQLRFVGAEIYNACFRELIFDQVLFREARLSNCDFSHSDLIHADFYHCNADSSRFEKTELSGANCSHSSFRQADFTKAILKKTNFCQSNLFAANFIRATVGHTNFDASNLDNTIFELAKAE